MEDEVLIEAIKKAQVLYDLSAINFRTSMLCEVRFVDDPSENGSSRVNCENAVDGLS
jgi:hypothetical protein